MIRQMVATLRAWMQERQHTGIHYQGIEPVKIQLVFTTDHDANEARRLFETSNEASILTRELGINFYRGVCGQYRIDGMTVEFLGPRMMIER